MSECICVVDDAMRAVTVKEPIVRCKDCKQGIETPEGIDCHGPLVQTWDYYNDELMSNIVQPDGFCAWAVRKEDA